MRFPPDGSGASPSRRAAPGSARSATRTSRAINGRILGVFQIESPLAVEHAAETAAIDGVDVLFVGPTDLSHSLGHARPLRRPGLSRGAPAGRGRVGGRRQGGRDPAPRRRRRCRATASWASGSSASARTGRSSPMGAARCPGGRSSLGSAHPRPTPRRRAAWPAPAPPSVAVRSGRRPRRPGSARRPRAGSAPDADPGRSPRGHDRPERLDRAERAPPARRRSAAPRRRSLDRDERSDEPDRHDRAGHAGLGTAAG